MVAFSTLRDEEINSDFWFWMFLPLNVQVLQGFSWLVLGRSSGFPCLNTRDEDVSLKILVTYSVVFYFIFNLLLLHFIKTRQKN